MSIYIVTVYNTTTKELEDVEVTEEVYKAFKRTRWNMEKNERKYLRNNTNFSELPGDLSEYFENMSSFVEVCDSRYRENISQIELHQILSRAMKILSDDDRKLIEALFYEGYSESAYAEKIGVTRGRVCQIKQQILSDLRQELEKSIA